MNIRTSDENETYTVGRFLGQKTGLLKRVEFSTRSRDTGDVLIAKVVPKYDPADLGLRNVEADFATVGKGTTKREALHSAVGEYVERYCALTGLPSEVRSATSYEMMATRDPTIPEFDLLTHYTDRQYRDAGAAPLAREETITWATGTSLVSGEQVALPSWLASSRIDSAHGFTSSNGCAAGQSLIGAAYRGLLEVVERDALMRCWYTRTAPDRIRLDEYSALRTLRDDCEPAGGRIELLSLDTAQPFEAVGAAYVGMGDRRPKFLLAASARLRFQDAVADALEEISQLIRVYRRLMVVDSETLDNDSQLDIGDNGLYYADPANFEAVEHLVSGATRAPEPADDAALSDVNISDSERLSLALEAFEQASRDVVLYELTKPEVREAGLCVVKAVIPELVPLCDPVQPAAGHPRLPDNAVKCDPHPVP